MTAPAERTTVTARRDDRSTPWFDALARDILLIRRCPRCGTTAARTPPTCPACHADELEWGRSPGQGDGGVRGIRSWREDPVSLGLIELDEGAWLAARLIAGPPPSPGSRVNLQILKPDESEPIPAFAVVRGITACCPLSSA